MGRYEWLRVRCDRGACVGTYVPIIFYGGSELGGKPNSRLVAILCVGAAYFLVGVLLPLVLFMTGVFPWPQADRHEVGRPHFLRDWRASLARRHEFHVIFATTTALAAAREAGIDLSTYRVFIAPLIFGLAPIINVLVATVWHPIEKGSPNDWTRFQFEMPHPLLWVGIILVAVGAGLVLYSKELTESKGHAPAPKTVAAATTAEPHP